ncbi:medium-chain dehydrogenase/reductase like protein [Rhodocollybia butyracea]|uniref:Medium-chain dehydrogenase/reductase like protein n=1 Tax=Rhodocollybia butyracea TaxID=206335 RepID=A0A9P5Q2E6_9AGAR|nr:medium-chain dehydrogenase/reductase like protein [Rhodocollybia butyracea]
MAEQKVLFLDKPKGSFVVASAPILKPGPGQISIKLKASALNPVDWKIQDYDFFIQNYPAILGTDLAGDVEEVGDGVEGFSKGDKVFCQGYFVNELAGFQQYTLMPADIVGKIPSNIDYAQAASIPLGYSTAAIGLLAAHPIVHREAALVIGGSASVFKHLGYSTIIAYASGRHTDFLKSIGATHVIDRGETPIEKVAETVKKIATTPLKIAYNAIGDADSRTACFDSIVAGGQVADVNGEVKDAGNGKTVIAIMGTSHFPVNREFGRILWKNLPKLVQDGAIVPNRVEKLPNGLAGINEGLQRMKANKISGVKLVALPQETV